MAEKKNINDQTVPWAQSNAKTLLKTEILIGDVTEDSNYLEVYYSNPEYQKYKKENFPTNLKNLLASIRKSEARAVFDANAVIQYQTMHPRQPLTNRGYPHWDTSEASRNLIQDIDSGFHKSMTLDELWNSRDSYKLFPKNVFRKHIYQECNKRLQTSYWLQQAQKKKEKEHLRINKTSK